MNQRKSVDLSRKELITMIGRLRGSLYGLVSEPNDSDTVEEAKQTLQDTNFDVEESLDKDGNLSR